MLCCVQAQLQDTQQQLSAATESHRRETIQLQAQLRQSSKESERNAQDLESAQEELQRLRERYENERQRLTSRQEGLLKVCIRPAPTRMLSSCTAKHTSQATARSCVSWRPLSSTERQGMGLVARAPFLLCHDSHHIGMRTMDTLQLVPRECPMASGQTRMNAYIYNTYVTRTRLSCAYTST